MKEEFYRETRLIRQAQLTVDRALKKIARERLYGREAWQIYEEVRDKVLKLFPDKRDTFNLIYWPRFSRIIWENMVEELEIEG